MVVRGRQHEDIWVLHITVHKDALTSKLQGLATGYIPHIRAQCLHHNYTSCSCMHVASCTRDPSLHGIQAQHMRQLSRSRSVRPCVMVSSDEHDLLCQRNQCIADMVRAKTNGGCEHVSNLKNNSRSNLRVGNLACQLVYNGVLPKQRALKLTVGSPGPDAMLCIVIRRSQHTEMTQHTQNARF